MGVDRCDRYGIGTFVLGSLQDTPRQEQAGLHSVHGLWRLRDHHQRRQGEAERRQDGEARISAFHRLSRRTARLHSRRPDEEVVQGYDAGQASVVHQGGEGHAPQEQAWRQAADQPARVQRSGTSVRRQKSRSS